MPLFFGKTQQFSKFGARFGVHCDVLALTIFVGRKIVKKRSKVIKRQNFVKITKICLIFWRKTVLRIWYVCERVIKIFLIRKINFFLNCQRWLYISEFLKVTKICLLFLRKTVLRIWCACERVMKIFFIRKIKNKNFILNCQMWLWTSEFRKSNENMPPFFKENYSLNLMCLWKSYENI